MYGKITDNCLLLSLNEKKLALVFATQKPKTMAVVLNIKTWKLLPSRSPYETSHSRSLFSILGTVRMDGKSQKPPSSKTRRKSSYGTSRRSILKKTFNQEQVTFTAPISDDSVVAIIGGGISGLICALFLEKRGVRSTLFDTVS